MNKQKWVTFVLGAAAVCLLVLMALNIMVDPFMQYHSPLTGMEPYYKYTQEYAMYWLIGRAKNTPAKAVLVGSSLSNFISSHKLSQQSGRKVIALNKSAGRPNIYSLFLRESLQRNHLQTIYYELNFPHLHMEYEGDIPLYLYNSNPFDDVKYVLNKDVTSMSAYILLRRLGEQFKPGSDAKRDKTSAIPVFEVDRSQSTSKYSTLAVARSLYVRHNQVADKGSVADYRTKAKKTVAEHIIPFLEDNPDIRFVFFIPCISILNTYDLCREGTVDDYLAIHKDIMLTLLRYNNVEIHMFSDLEGFVDNLDNYKDRVHYAPPGGDLICDGLQTGEYRITAKNIEARLQHLKSMAQSFEISFLKEGFSGDDVLEMKHQLIALGYKCPAGKVYDPQTRDAVAEFQAAQMLEVTGIATAETRALLKELCNAIR
ncbi:peptidoglycan-binding domain-containing protein [Syntrophomonas palmitatica]|uniref:peptidoglycan-binding domain-containing protein n=1 Tax=Syntrophomonas palmitatica TaxID=402877 RepID=UPI0006D1B934|nr:peptidoglycan-binding domain-containing protein [Syntrophomonas palmitatica]